VSSNWREKELTQMALARVTEFLRSAGNSASARFLLACFRSIFAIREYEEEAAARRLASDLHASGLACRVEGGVHCWSASAASFMLKALLSNALAEVLQVDPARWHWLHVRDRIADPKDALAELAPLVRPTGSTGSPRKPARALL
jgi:hypothetical protein